MQSARGPIPNLAEFVAGEPIRGSWWGHASGHEIFAVLSRVRNSPDVIATRLVNGKVTLIHRRLWPALVRVADRFPRERLAAVDEEHTASGAHRTTAIPFPEWVPAQEITAARLLTVDDALGTTASVPPLIREAGQACDGRAGMALAHKCWDQIIGDLRASTGDESPAPEDPAGTSQPGRVGRPG